MSTAPVLFITGGGSGIGRAIALLFAGKGYRVAITGRRQAKLDETAAAIHRQHGSAECMPLALDIGDGAAVRRVVQQVVDRWGTIDLLVNNAGSALGSPKPFFEQSVDDIKTVIDTNIFGTLYVTHAVLQLAMMPNKGGHGTIVNVSSITGLEAPPMGEATYHTSKAAIEGFSTVLRQELTGTNVRLLVVRPGFVGGGTNFHGNRLGEKDAEQDVFAGLPPLEEADVARAVEFVVETPEHVSIRAIDVVPTAQRSLHVADRTWNERNTAPTHDDA